MDRSPQSLALAGLLGFAVLAALTDCGGRSSLRDGRVRGDGAGGFGGQPAPDAGIDAGPDAGPPTCTLGEPNLPTMVAPLTDRDAHTPSVVAVDPGQAGLGGSGSGTRPAQVALQTVTSNNAGPDGIEAMLLQIEDTAWPGGLTVPQPLTMVAGDTWTYAQMVRAPQTTDALAIAYNGGPGHVRLRLLDVASWTASAAVDVWPTSGTPLHMARGAGIAPMGGGYDGDGLALVWDAEADVPVAVVTAPTGQVWVGPHRVLGEAAVPFASPPVLAWSGREYLLATVIGPCPVPDPLCAPYSLAIARIRPPSGDAYDDSGIELVGSIPSAAQPESPAGAPSLASLDDLTVVAWPEPTDPLDPAAGTTIQAARIGQVVGEAKPVAVGAEPVSGIRLSISRLGVVVAWPEAGNPSLADGTLGRSVLVLQQLDRQLVPMAPPRRLDITRFSSWGLATSVGLEHPRGLLVGWSARALGLEREAVFVSTLPCNP